RNEKRIICINDTQECERTVNDAPDEIRDMGELLPAGRKLQVGMYFVGLGGGPNPTIRYDYDLARLALNLPAVGSAVAYGLPMPGLACTDSNFLQDRFCALQRAYGGKPQHVTHSDLTPNGASARSNPAAYFAAADRRNHAIYRSGDGHLHEL